MQDKHQNHRYEGSQEHKKKTERPKSQKSGQAYIDKLISKLSPKDKEDTRLRLRNLVSWIGSMFLSWVLSAGKLFFGIQPFSLALLSVTEKNIIPVFLGILISCVSGRTPLALLWGATVILIFRIIVSFVPDFHEKSRDKIKATSINLDSINSGDVPLIDSGEVQKKSFFYSFVKLLGKLFCISDGKTPADERDSVHRRYNEVPAARALFSSVGGFVYGLFLLISNDYAFYNMFGALCAILICPILVLLLFGGMSSQIAFRGWWHTFSWFALLCAVVYSAADTSLLGMPLAPLAAMLFTLLICGMRGVVSGAVCGLVLGLIYNPLYAPLLCICAIIYGFIAPLKKSIAVGSVCIGTVLWCYYFGGISGLVGTLTPMLVAIPVFFACDRYYCILYPERTPKDTEEVNKMFEGKARRAAGIYFAEAVSEREKNEVMTDRLGALSEAFSSLSQTFNGLVDRFRRPDILGIKKIADGAMENNCNGCRNRDVCWGAGYTKTLEVTNKISSSLHKKGCVDDTDLPESFMSSCPRADRIIKDVNSECEKATENIIQGHKIGTFASNFDDISAILKDALEGADDEYECDLEASEKIFDIMTEAGYKIKGVVVCGKRNRRVLIKGIVTEPQTEGFSGTELCRKFSEIVGFPLMGPIFEMSADETVMTFYSKPKMSAICSHGRLAADNDSDSAYAEILEDDGVYFFKSDTGDNVSACGDCTRVFVNENSYFYSLISDGMGSGADAALASEVSSMFVEKMLMAGNRADITVRMLNNFLRSENAGLGRECSATLDLFELDLMNGSASFIKSGAAPTYIYRGKKVYKVNSRTMPVGIIKQADAKLTRFDTMPEDLIIMISDGCCPDSEDCPWLVDFLSALDLPEVHSSPEQMESFTSQVKDKILGLAVENTPQSKHQDDISVCVVLISA